MNEPGQIIEPSECNIIKEYRRYEDVAHVSRVLRVESLRSRNMDLTPLYDIGMSERNFYCDRD